MNDKPRRSSGCEYPRLGLDWQTKSHIFWGSPPWPPDIVQAVIALFGAIAPELCEFARVERFGGGRVWAEKPQKRG